MIKIPGNDGTGPIGIGPRDGRGRKYGGRGQNQKGQGQGKKTGGKLGDC
ncbi:unnamed protein product [marine sediment metagenome]|uniref:Uncharacterized protein n=1 Tax=marine sediment metagenome TaxID=412755 RepID=X1T8U8_9ZZZZ